MDISLYTRYQCSACEQVKTLLHAKGIEAKIINIQEDDDAAASLVRDGIRSVPVLEIDGERYVGATAIVGALQ